MLLWTTFSVLWVAAGIAAVSWFACNRSLVAVLRVGLPVFTTATMLVIVGESPADSPLPRIVHHAGFTLLGVFLLMSETLRARLRRLRRSRACSTEVVSLCNCFRAASVLCAPSAAIIILLSGWRLMHDSGWSLRAPWLWWVYVLFAAMMWHGVFYWTADAKRLAAEPQKGLPRGVDWIMTAHGLLFLLIFAIAFNGAGRSWPHPCPGAIAALERGLAFLPRSWRAVGAAVGVWVAIGIVAGIAFQFSRPGE